MWGMDDAELLTTKQAAEIMGRSGRSVRRLIQGGTLRPPLRLRRGRGAYYLTRADVQAYRDVRAPDTPPAGPAAPPAQPLQPRNTRMNHTASTTAPLRAAFPGVPDRD